MKIKEFAHKNGLIFFYTTIVLLIVLVLVLILDFNDKRPRFDRYNRDGFNRPENQKDMMKYQRNRMNTEFDNNEEVLPSLDNQ